MPGFPQLLVGVFLSVTWLGAAPPPGYYATAEGKSGRQLRQALHSIISVAEVLHIDSTPDIIKTLDQDPSNSNNVILIYSGFSTAKTNFGLASGWNREHVWPRSYGIADGTPAESDLRNLFACDSTVNSSRGNKFFDESNVFDPNFRSSAHVEAPGCSTDSNSWEPRANEKGDIARILFYMDVRYDRDWLTETNLSLTSDTDSITSAGTRMGKLVTLLLWHDQDPVDDAERMRNEEVAILQRNRNPFVDHPEWVALVYHPILGVSLTGEGVQLRWEDIFDVIPQSRLSVTATWTTIAVRPTNESGFWILDRRATNATEFFRLRVR